MGTPLGAGFSKRYLEREGYFADAKRSQARRRLPAVAQDISELLRTFEGDTEVCSLSSYGTLERLFDEQCEVVSGGEDGEEPTPVPAPDEATAQPGGPEPEDPPAPETDPEPRIRVVPAEEPSGDLSQAEVSGVSGDSESPEDGSGPSAEGGTIRLKKGKEISSSSLQSPYDPDATYGHKGKGYEVQISETCAESNPYQVLTGIAVNGSNESDQNALVPMIEQLEQSGMAPDELYADTGYGSGDNIIESAERGVDLQAPVQDPNAPKRPDPWEKPASTLGTPEGPEAPSHSDPHDTRPQPGDPIDIADFVFTPDFDEVLSCPMGFKPEAQHLDSAKKKIWAQFSAQDCAACPFANQCPTRPKRSGDRTLRILRREAATGHRQRLQRTRDFKERYKIRSGIESSNAEIKGCHGAGDLRVRGQKRVTLAMLLKGAAVNVKRAVRYHTNKLRDLYAAAPARSLAAAM